MRKIFIFFYFSLILAVGIEAAAVTGVAFRDYNADGVQQAGESGVGGIVVKAYKNDIANKDAFVTQVTTGANGSYVLSFTDPVRLEFEIPASGNVCNLDKTRDFPSAGGQAYGTSVQFVKVDGEVHNFAISYPYSFSIDENPSTFTTIMQLGDPLGGGSTGESSAIVKFNFNNSGVSQNSGGSGPAWTELAKSKYVGTTRALAYSRQANRLFAAAYVKRHAGIGPLGSGGIYMLDPDINNTTATGIEFINLDSIGIATHGTGIYSNALTAFGSNEVFFSDVLGSNTDRGLGADINMTSTDSAAYAQVGRLGLGDIDISEDGRYLYVVNLYDRKLYKIDLVNPNSPEIPDAADVASFSIPDTCTYPKAGEYRPFGLKIARGRAYVGITCSGQEANGTTVSGATDADMKGSVYSMDLSTEIWSPTAEAEWTFDYRHSTVYASPNWRPWTGKFLPVDEYEHLPMVGDIEFDNQNNMIVGIIDIRADMQGHHNMDLNGEGDIVIASAGDLLKIDVNSSGSSCVYTASLTPEFYADQILHDESTGGMIAGHHTSLTDSVMVTAMDPLRAWSSGVALFSNIDGSQERLYELVLTQYDETGIGKTNGLGDLETLEVVPPIEIGNLIWRDSDRDGVQDADENGIAGVHIQLLDNTDTVIATTTTDSNGNYIFNHSNVDANSTTPGLKPNTSYTVRIAATQFTAGAGVGGTVLANLTLTNTDSSGTSSAPDSTDSDASLQAGLAEISLTTSADPGHNDHTFDIGLALPPAPAITVEKTTNGDDADTTNGPHLHIGDSVTWDYNITNTGTEALSTVVLTDDKEGTITCPSNTLAIGASMLCTQTDTVTALGVYSNEANVTAIGDVSGTTVSDTDPSHYYVPAVSIGSVIWSDANNNGIQDAGESGIAGAKVTLLDASGNPVAGIATQTTATDGLYYFDQLPEGNYSVKVDMSSVSGYTPAANQVADADNDVDNDTNIASTAGQVYTSGTVTLTAGTEPTEANGLSGTDSNDNANETNGNMTVDFGFFPLGSWSGNVSKDTDDDNTGDLNLEGVTITLYTDPNGDGDPSDGTVVGTATTDANGNYTFINLPIGDYVAIETQPEHMLDVSENEGGADDDDNGNAADNNQISGHVGAGEHDQHNDFVEEDALFHVGTHFWVDNDGDGNYTQGGSDEPIGGALVELLDENGSKLYWTDETNTSTTTQETDYPIETNTTTEGEYGFDVPAGTYQVRFHIPDSLRDKGYVFDQQQYNNNDAVNVNTANDEGITQTVTVGGSSGKSADLTLDGSVNCGCADASIQSNGGDALGTLGLLLMILMILGSGLLFVRREAQTYAEGN